MKERSLKFQTRNQFEGAWSLARARDLAAAWVARSDQRRARSELLEACAHNEGETRKRAADLARRISERRPDLLRPLADAFASLLASTALGESRTRWHLGLVVARTAHNASQVATATELMWLLAEDKSTVVRCSALEGLGLLARKDPTLLADVEPYLHRALQNGTAAVRCRARDALALLSRASD